MSLALTYFGFDGSRGLECRLALTVAGKEFEDRRIDRAQWKELKPNTPFGALPMLHDGQRLLPQSVAILTYIGRSNGMHPTDLWQAALHEAVMHSVEDLRAKMPSTKGMDEDAAVAVRTEFANGWLTQWATNVSGLVEGPFLAGDDISVADLKLYVILRAYLAGVYDHIPATVFDGFPKLGALYAAVDNHPAVAQYWAARA